MPDGGDSPMTESMQAAIFYGGKDIRVEERPIPVPTRGEVLVRIRSAGICGGDLLGYNGIGPWQPPPGVGIEEGHELAGEVAGVGPDVHGFALGERVVVQPEHLISCGSCRECHMGSPHLCRHLGSLNGAAHHSHGFSQYDTVLASHLRRLPSHLSFESGAIADCYGVAVHAVNRAGGVRGRHVAVIGSGTIGQCVGQTARALGADAVVMIGHHPEPLDLALRTGAATHVLRLPEPRLETALRDLGGATGPEVVFDSVGKADTTLQQAVDAVARGGTICVVGTFTESPVVDPNALYSKELSILWANSYGLHDGESELDRALALMAGAAVQPEPLITHRFPLARIEEAFVAANDKATSGAIKVMVLP